MMTRQHLSSHSELPCRWKTSKLQESAEPEMDTEHFIPAELAPEAEGWDPMNPNGFPAKPADKNNVNGVPGQ